MEGEEDEMEVADEDELDSEETVSFQADQGADREEQEDDDVCGTVAAFFLCTSFSSLAMLMRRVSHHKLRILP